MTTDDRQATSWRGLEKVNKFITTVTKSFLHNTPVATNTKEELASNAQHRLIGK